MMTRNSILIVGATGFVGGAVARHLVAAGHEVTGTARQAAGAQQLAAAAITPLIGDLDHALDTIVAAAKNRDVVIYAAQTSAELERRAVTALLETLAGTHRRLIFTSGTGVLLQRTGGAWSGDCFAEDDPFEVEPLAAVRVEVESLVRASAARGVHAIVLRPPLVWGPSDHGHVALTYRSVKLTGAACYVGSGLASFSHLHIDDVARLFALAIERGAAGALYHAVGGEIPNRWIAEAVARDLGCETRSITLDEAQNIWGELGALVMSSSSRARSERTHAELGWSPRITDMLSTIGEPRLRALAGVADSS